MYQIVEVSVGKNSVLPKELEVGSKVEAKSLKTAYKGIKATREEMGLGYDVYVRRLLLEGKLEGIKVDHGHYNKWHIYIPSVERYMEEHRRTEQARRFILRAELEDRAKIEKALDEAGIQYELELAYKGK